MVLIIRNIGSIIYISHLKQLSTCLRPGDVKEETIGKIKVSWVMGQMALYLEGVYYKR